MNYGFASFNCLTLYVVGFLASTIMASDLNSGLSTSTFVFGLKLWVVIGIFVGVFIVILVVLLLCRKKSKRANEKLPVSQAPIVSKEFKEIGVDHVSANNFVAHDELIIGLHEKFSEKESDKLLAHPSTDKTMNGDDNNRSGPFNHIDIDSGSRPLTVSSPLTGLPEFSHLGWGHWFTLRDLEVATNRFSKDNVVGEGGYGVVYQGHLSNGSPVAVKKLLNNL